MNKMGLLINTLSWLEPLACLGALAFIKYRKQTTNYLYVCLFLIVRLTSLAILLPLIHLSGHGVGKRLAYDIYFYVYFSSYAAEAVLSFLIIYSLYRMAMAPLPGLQRLGILMFRWAGIIGVALALSTAFGPHTTPNGFVMKFVAQLQQTQSVLTLCMLLFVCLASKPMGLSHRSKLFGVSLGLGVLAMTDLVVSAWMTHSHTVYNLANVFNGLAVCLALGIWTAYFALPEPKRRMIVLPTTSPFLRWNQISQVLGDEPGFVVLGEVIPEMFAPAEMEIMLRASSKMRPLATQRMSAVS